MQPEKFTPLPDFRVSPLKAKRFVYLADIPQFVTKETVLKPEYWASISTKVKPKDHIEADWEDGSKLMILRVLTVGLDFVKVAVISEHDFTVEAKSLAAKEFSVRWIAPGTHKWGVVRNSNKEYVQTGFDSERTANEWLKENLDKIAA